ncbi:mechanosensitive ion channel family protein [Thiotrichales bacterium 19S11-10]|nr:mechanosensitive ion channel family protein [Thiotrichales bacterium 19S11-10]MCF6806887.1 mechanosensitive ion channel family protein [Thiotrichales bacterium 19S9-11]MCF6810856.1 mechanosensitive ion channel family protein [Thiotrichales bacterium 19S9-12]
MFDQLSNLINGLSKSHQDLYYLISIGVVLLLVIAINLMIRFILKRLNKRVHLTHEKPEWLRFFYFSINKPLRVIMWLIGFWIIFDLINTWLMLSESIDTVANQALRVGIILCTSWASFRFIKHARAFGRYKAKRTDGGYSDFSIVESITKFAQIFVIIATALTIMAALSIPIAGILTLGTVGTGVVAFANKNAIENFLGGFSIYLDRPFSIGDWIYTTDGKIEGTVEAIGWRLTKIRAFDKRLIYVPNVLFLSAAVVNASRMSNRRILQYIGVRYCDFKKIDAIMHDIRNMLKESNDIDQTCTTLVNLINGSTNVGSTTEGCYGSSSINFMIYTFTKTTNWARFQNIQDKIMLTIGKIIESHQAQIAFSTTTLDIPAPTLEALSGKVLR